MPRLERVDANRHDGCVPGARWRSDDGLVRIAQGGSSNAGDVTATTEPPTIEPGTSLDLSSFGADFAYVVVLKGVVDASDGTELVPPWALAWAADAGSVTIAPRSPNVGAFVLVVAVAPAA